MTRAGCGRREIAQAGQLRQSWDPDFNGALFFLGTVLTYIYTYIYTHTHTHIYKSLSVHECEGVAVIFSVKKEKAKITKQCVWPL